METTCWNMIDCLSLTSAHLTSSIFITSPRQQFVAFPGSQPRHRRPPSSSPSLSTATHRRLLVVHCYLLLLVVAIVLRHRWTGRYEAHLWDKNCWNESHNKKERQGAYDDEEAAAHAYDLAALKYWGEETILNFPSTKYEKEIKEMEGFSKEE
ncbi:hypothetical protein Scep_026141 [Stephania cephalantha]|uniref:AP2/ERF domain-containing protein n=1 Tax=Stephania cephalantha TaxID=152367 RepID=A0AAP0EMS8_9MAGN